MPNAAFLYLPEEASIPATGWIKSAAVGIKSVKKKPLIYFYLHKVLSVTVQLRKI